jgi:hypothetical protein
LICSADSPSCEPGELTGQDVGVPDYADEEVVEVVGDAARQDAETLPSLSLAQLVLRRSD